ncbi:MAG: DoxX family protein [Corynebacterium sp.]|nr:DoxX family protein [Corynebacterium sp.]
MNHPAVRDAALLILRLALGVVFVAHGWDILFHTGIIETAGQFSAVGVPDAKIAAYVACAVQLIAGLGVLLGFITGFFAGVLAIFMCCAFYFVHLGHGIFVNQGGAEYVMVMFAALVVLVVFGPGRVSVDGVLTR